MHDTIEDTDTSVEELVEAFGGPIASLVQEVTDDQRLPKAERKLRQVEHAAHLSPKARRVKLADKIANLRDVADSPPVGIVTLTFAASGSHNFVSAATLVAAIK